MSYPPNPPPPYNTQYPNTRVPAPYPQGSTSAYPEYQGDNETSRSGKPKSGLEGQLKNVGGFLGQNKMQAATMAFNYKFGGGLGKILAAGQAADLASRYKKDDSHHNLSPGYGSGHEDYGNRPKSAQGHSGGGGIVSQGLGVAPGGAGNSHKSGSKNIASTLMEKGSKFLGSNSGGGGHKEQNFSHVENPYNAYPNPQPDYQGPPDFMFPMQTGRVISLAAPIANGRCLQVVQAPNGNLTLDALGDMNMWNAKFNVLRLDEYTVALSNCENYVAIEPYGVVLQRIAGAGLPPACYLRVQSCQSGVSLSNGPMYLHADQFGHLTVNADAFSYSASWQLIPNV